MKMIEKIRRIPPHFKLGALAVMFSFVLGICFPYIKEWMLAKEAPPTPLRITPPAAGQQVQTDAFSVQLFQYYLQNTGDNLTITPDATTQCLSALKLKATPEAAALFTPLQLCGKPAQSSAALINEACLFTNAADTLPQNEENSIVYQAPFSADYTKALQLVNGVIYRLSGGSISNMCCSASAPPTTRILATTLVNFKADWYYPIYTAHTKQQIFRNADGVKKEVPFMQAKGNFRIATDPKGEWKAVALFMRNTPQGDAAGHDSCALILIQPTATAAISARPLATRLNVADYNNIRTALATASETSATIGLPRICELRTLLDVRSIPVLQDLGLGAITESQAAPFPGLSATTPFPLTGFIQYNVVTFEESPDHAVAPADVGPCDTTINFDRPFIWMLCPLTTAEPPYLMGVIEKMN